MENVQEMLKDPDMIKMRENAGVIVETQKMVKLIEKHNVPVYQDLRTWVEAAGALVQFGKIQGK